MSAGTATIELLPDLPLYTADQDVLVRMSFFDTAGDPIDAGEVTLTVVRPDGVQDEYTLSGGGVTHPSTGVYERTVTMTMPADWIFHSQGSTIVAAAQVSATVDDSPLFDDTPPMPSPGLGNEGKIARVTGGAYAPYGGGADEQPLVWRTGTGWVGQALNLAAAAAVSGLLAISHIAPGSNGQVLTTVGGVATWAAAASVPGGGTGEVQYNNGGVLDGASGIKVAGAETALAFGTNPATVGLVRFVHNPGVALLSARNQANSGDAAIVQWGAGANDRLTLGSTLVAEQYFNLATGGTYNLQVNGVTEYSLSSTIADFKDNALQFGTNPAAGGLIRVPYNTTILNGRDSGNTTDIQIIRWGTTATTLLFGANNGGITAISCQTTGAGTFNLIMGATTEYTFDSSKLDMTNNAVQFGTNPATAGVVRFAHTAGSLIAGRNNANSGDVDLFRWGANANDRLTVGSSNVVDLYYNVATGASHNFQINTVIKLTLDTGKVFLANSTSVPSSDPVGGGYIYIDSGALKYRGSSGTVTTVGAA